MTEVEQRLSEARCLAERVALDQFEGRVPSADDTVRLCELLDILLDIEESRIESDSIMQTFEEGRQ